LALTYKDFTGGDAVKTASLNKMKIKILKPTSVEGKITLPGTVVEVDGVFGSELINFGKGEETTQSVKKEKKTKDRAVKGDDVTTRD
jgi:hypothetical protein|tara:strand:+ start:512 stop:772 length:261 start_codon:yes stop_codon:yes gene_type:complete